MYITLALNIIYLILKVIFLIRAEIKGLPVETKTHYETKISRAKKKHKGNPMHLLTALEIIREEVKEEIERFRRR